MAAGNTTTGSLADSLDTVVASARIVREYEGVMPQLVEKQTLKTGTGLDWKEVRFEKLEAQDVTETEEHDNPQQISDSSFTITPTVTCVETCITDRVAARISPTAYAKIGSLAQNAIQRKKDKDGLTMLDSFSNSYCGAGSTLTSGHVSAAMGLITGNATEPGNPPFRCVLHPYQIHDINDEIVAGVGTYIVNEGLTARVFSEGFRGMIAGAQLYPDGNITIDSSTDAKGGVFAQEALVLVQGRAPRLHTEWTPKIGGGATKIYHFDEYAYGERRDTWGVEIYSDATAPTS
jgi:hypothetical protein